MDARIVGPSGKNIFLHGLADYDFFLCVIGYVKTIHNCLFFFAVIGRYVIGRTLYGLAHLNFKLTGLGQRTFKEQLWITVYVSLIVDWSPPIRGRIRVVARWRCLYYSNVSVRILM